MSDNQDKNLEAIAKLLFLTQQGKINWTPIDPNKVKTTYENEIISFVFSTSYKEKRLRIYKRKYKTLQIITPSIRFSIQDYLNPVKETVWVSEIALEITDNYGNPIWRFPEEEILRDLLEAIKYKASGAHDLINSLLSDESEPDIKSS